MKPILLLLTMMTGTATAQIPAGSTARTTPSEVKQPEVSESRPSRIQRQRCNVPVANAPELRGFKLGMTLDEARARSGLISIPASPRIDETGFFQASVLLPDLGKAQREGIKSLELGFLDGKLVSIQVSYDATVTWPDEDQFGISVAKSLGIPDAWEKVEMTGGMKQLCGEVAFAFIGHKPPMSETLEYPTLFIYRTDTHAIRAERRSRSEEMKRGTFKP
jgi:hypothetical protein